MKILFISDFFQPYSVGAANISTFLSAKKLSEDNECYVITQKFEKEPWVYGGLTVYPLLPKYFPSKSIKDILKTEFLSFLRFQNIFTFYRSISEFCKLKNIDVINVQSNNMALLISLLFLSKPVVIDVRDYYFTCPFMLKPTRCDKFHLFCMPSYNNKRLKWYVNFLSIVFFRYQALLYFIEKNLIFKSLLLFKKEKCVFVPLSNYVREILKKEFKNININTQVIYNPINTNDYKKKVINKQMMILYCSLLENSKGIWDCIHAFEKFKNNIIFKIAGDGPEIDSIKDYIRNKKINNIEVLGHMEYKLVPQLYLNAYITVQPSVWPEPFGRYILESFASGTPLITTPTGGTPEAIIDRETGLLVPPNNSQKIAAAISELLANKKLYNHIQKNIINEAKRFHPDITTKQRLSLYKSLVNK